MKKRKCLHYACFNWSWSWNVVVVATPATELMTRIM